MQFWGCEDLRNLLGRLRSEASLCRLKSLTLNDFYISEITKLGSRVCWAHHIHDVTED